MERRYFNSSLGKISYLFREGRFPIIFLHGLAGTGNSWIKLAQFMDASYSLYMLDLLGHGRSAKPEIEYTVEAQETILKEILEEINQEKFSLVGNSYGGWISMRFAMDVIKPDYLVLEDTAGINVTFGELPDDIRGVIARNLVDRNRMNSKKVIESIMINNSNPIWKLKEEELRNLNSKVLIIWGSDDSIIPKSYGLRLNALIPGSNFVEIKGGGHVPHIFEPKQVATILNYFFKS